MLFIYNIIINLVILFSPIVILVRILKKKEHPIRFLEKFSIASKKRGNGKIIWFHGSSVGEILSIIPLIEKFENRKDINRILITSSTLSSSKVLSNYKFRKTIHQFFPIDSKFFVNRFLSYWNPSIAIFIESEIWPNMIFKIKDNKIPLVLLNARITNKTFKRWKILNSFSKNIFKCFDITFPQNEETKKYLFLLGARKIDLIGNLKFSENETKKQNSIKNKIIKFFRSKLIWCASSTHHNEEILCAKTHMKLKKKYPNLLTIIIPRHVNRIDNIKSSIESLKLNTYCHSEKKIPNKDIDIYFVDTYGETKSFFQISKTVFLGGSIIKHGGQNPLEAIRFGCKVLHGPNVKNFKEIYNLLKLYNLSLKINNINQLINALKQSFSHNSNSEKKIKKLKKMGLKILNITYAKLGYYIKKNEIKKT